MVWGCGLVTWRGGSVRGEEGARGSVWPREFGGMEILHAKGGEEGEDWGMWRRQETKAKTNDLDREKEARRV